MKTAKYFTATWCGPCRSIKPKINELKNQGLSIQIIDVDQQAEETTNSGVRNIPTIILIQDGVVQQRMVGNDINIETIKQFFN
jgi:thioredoxin 1